MKLSGLGYSLMPLLLFASATAAADKQVADRKSATTISAQACYGCHAEPGTQATGLVAFSATGELDIANKLKAFRNGELTGTVMNRISRGYTPAELEQLAAGMASAFAKHPPGSR